MLVSNVVVIQARSEHTAGLRRLVSAASAGEVERRIGTTHQIVKGQLFSTVNVLADTFAKKEMAVTLAIARDRCMADSKQMVEKASLL